jgi:hypothetical protein
MQNQSWKLTTVLAGFFLTSGLAMGQEAGAGLLKPGDKIPGPFQTLGVTQPPATLKPIAQAGRYHCPVCEYRLNPAVLIFAKQLDSPEDAGKSASLTSLLKKLDAAIGKHTEALAGACAIFGDSGYQKQLQADLEDATGSTTAPVKDADFTKTIEFKEKAEARLKESAKAADLKHISLSLGLPDAYPIPANNDVRILFYYKHDVIFDEAFSRDKLTDAAIDKIVKSIEEKLSEVEKANLTRKQ